jgi:hypothetical protein
MQKQALQIALLCLLCLPALPAQILFEKRYGDNLDNLDYAGGSMLALDGGLVLGGYTERDKNYDAFVQKFNTDGTEAWYKTYGGPGTELVVNGAPTVSDGYLFAGAALDSADGSLDALLFHVDENGDLLWWKTYGADAADVGLAVCQLDNGHIVLLGATTLPNGQSAHFRTEYDVAGGFKSAVFYPLAGAVTSILATATPDGGYAAVLTFGDIFSSSSSIIKYNAALMPEWSKTGASLNMFTGGSSVEGILDVKATGTGVLLCTKTWAGSHLFHLGYPTGSVLWARRAFSGSAPNTGVQVWPDSTISVVSHSFNLLVKTISADGTTIDSTGNPFGQISSIGTATFHFLDSETLYRTVNNDNSNVRGYNVARIEQIKAPVLGWEQAIAKIVPPEVESSKAIAAMPDGGFVVLGTKEDSIGTNQIWLFRADPQGAVLWSRLFDVRTNQSFFQPGSLKTDAAGNSIALTVTYGYDFINSINIAEYRLLKVSPSGNLLFIKTIATSNYEADYFGAMPLPDGGYIAHITFDNGDDQVPNLVRTDANGNVLWTKAYSGRLINDVVALPNGNFVGAGIKGATPWIFATDAAGNLLWEHSYSIGASGLLVSLTPTSDGHLIATGYSLNAAGTSALLFVLKADGNTGAKMWHKQFSKGDENLWFGVKALPGPAGGAVVVSTYLMPPANINDQFYGLFRSRVGINAVDADGNMISDQVLGDDGSYPSAPGADRTSDGKALLCATLQVGSSLADVWVAKVDINTATATHQPRFEGDITLSPNPAAGQIRIAFTSPHTGPVLVRMFDANGREVLRTTGDKQTETWATPIELNRLPTGLYRVQVVMREGQVMQSVVIAGK